LFHNSSKKGRLSQRPERHVGETGQSRVVGAAASGDANAGDVRDQELGDRLGIETDDNITLPLRIADDSSGRSSLKAAQFISSGSVRVSRKQPRTPPAGLSTSPSCAPASAGKWPTCC
jgi:hypothetical protein